MTLTSDAMAATSPPEATAAAPRALSATRPFYWSVRRELWENRSIYLAPLIAAGVILFGCAIAATRLSHIHYSGMMALDPAKQSVMALLPYGFAAIAIMLVGEILGFFYCLSALHGERRDRSILFWKSLPVSNLTTVLAKASIPLIVLPVVLFAVIVATQLVMLALGAAAPIPNGVIRSTPWTHVPLLRMWLILLYGLAALSLWYAPIWSWLLLVSGWARRNPILWAILPPLAVCVLERIAFDTSYASSLLSYRLGGFEAVFHLRSSMPMSGGLPRIDPAGYLATPGLWAGLVFAGAFLAAAVWQRRRAEPI